MVQNDDTRERITKALNKVGCFGPNLIRECVDAVMAALVSGGGEWTALREALVRTLDEHRRIPFRSGEGADGNDCTCGWQADFCNPKVYDWQHRMHITDVFERKALAAAAPARQCTCPVDRPIKESHARVCPMAPPPQDGQGAELSGPPPCSKCDEAHRALDTYGVARGAMDHSVRYRIGLLAELVDAHPTGTITVNAITGPNGPFSIPPRGGSSSDLAEQSAELRAATVQGYNQALRDAERACRRNTAGCDKPNVACHYSDVEAVRALTPPSLPEAVAGNASAPVGEKVRDTESFTRGRHWELAEYENHLRSHNSQIGGVCSWCKLETQWGRVVQPQPSGVGEPREPKTARELAEALCDCADRTLNGRARELANELRAAL